MPNRHSDVLIIGAGLSGICSAYHLQEKCPDKSFLILEGRNNLGGTWDLFKYPGIRSDSDMTTLGYRFRPWVGEQQIADASAIKEYINATAEEADIKKHIVYNTLVIKAEWSSDKKNWLVFTKNAETGETMEYSCSFLLTCCGYYNYKKGYTPEFKNLENYKGKFIHPQQWPEDLDYKGKTVTIIGSGATAITLVPAMAKGGAKHVTMLQRSPSYYVIMPKTDPSISKLSRFISEKRAYSIVRWRNILIGKYFYKISKSFPNFSKKILIKQVRKTLPEGYDIEKHFTPKYNPWDQRVCIVPDNDFFISIKEGSASVLTEKISQFTEKGIQLESGEEIISDIVVSATGLDLIMAGGIEFHVDGQRIEAKNHFAYKSGVMLNNIPNLAAISGYTNASWTLKADLSAEFVCRLINHMDKNAYQKAVPIFQSDQEARPFIENFSSGYIMRSSGKFPSQGEKQPWRINQDYKKDVRLLRHSKLDDGYLEFS